MDQFLYNFTVGVLTLQWAIILLRERKMKRLERKIDASWDRLDKQAKNIEGVFTMSKSTVYALEMQKRHFEQLIWNLKNPVEQNEEDEVSNGHDEGDEFENDAEIQTQ